MTLLLQLLLLSLLMSMILLLLGMFTTKKLHLDMEKLSPFECGFSMKNFHRSLFSTQFFLVAMIFIIFDVELIILFPVLSLSPSLMPLKISFFFTVITIILSSGLLWEWSQSMLEWAP